MHCAFYKDGQVAPIFETDLPAFPTISRYAILPLLEDALHAWKQALSDASDIHWDRFVITGMAAKKRSDLEDLKESYRHYVNTSGVTCGTYESAIHLFHTARSQRVQL